jgi:hypothetical protein
LEFPVSLAEAAPVRDRKFPIARLISEFIADQHAGAAQAVVRAVCEIGVRGVFDLRDHPPVAVDVQAECGIFVEEDVAAERGAVLSIVPELSVVQRAAETALDKDEIIDIRRPGKTGKDLVRFAGRGDVSALAVANMPSSCALPSTKLVTPPNRSSSKTPAA